MSTVISAPLAKKNKLYTDNGISVLSLFDGMGCGRLALDRAGIPVANYFAAEVDKFAIRVTTAKWPGIIHFTVQYYVQQKYKFLRFIPFWHTLTEDVGEAFEYILPVSFTNEIDAINFCREKEKNQGKKKEIIWQNK